MGVESFHHNEKEKNARREKKRNDESRKIMFNVFYAVERAYIDPHHTYSNLVRELMRPHRLAVR